MRRSRTLLFALMVALIASFALPMAASAGSSSDVDCPELTESEAQSIYDADPSDPNRLDADDDGLACEENESETVLTDASVDEYPREGIASGGGSTAAGGPSPVPLLLSAGVFALLATGSWGLKGRLRR